MAHNPKVSFVEADREVRVEAQTTPTGITRMYASSNSSIDIDGTDDTRVDVDVAIIDTPWNGVAESLKIASMADAFEVNVAPHNFYGHLATMQSAAFCAVAPNVRIMEFDPDMVPWQDDLFTVRPDIRDGYLHLPTGPGWGTDVNEEAVRAHPGRR